MPPSAKVSGPKGPFIDLDNVFISPCPPDWTLAMSNSVDIGRYKQGPHNKGLWGRRRFGRGGVIVQRWYDGRIARAGVVVDGKPAKCSHLLGNSSAPRRISLTYNAISNGNRGSVSHLDNVNLGEVSRSLQARRVAVAIKPVTHDA